MPYTKSEIDGFLQGCFFSVLNFKKDGHLVSELMIFSHDANGDFYLWSRKLTENFDSIKENPNVSLLIYKEEETLADMKYCNLWGIAEIIEDFNSEKAKIGYDLIGEKSPVAKQVPSEENEHKNTLICVSAEHIEVIGFKDLKAGEGPTILEINKEG